MPSSRRQFIGSSIKTIILIGLGKTVKAFPAEAFILPPVEKLNLRFAMASDGHFGQPETKFDETHDEMMGWLNKEHAARGLDFTMINGDLVHDDHKLFAAVKTKYDMLKMPYYVSHGNHDRCDPETWEKAWDTPLQYSFEKKGVAFIVLDTADDTGGYICPEMSFVKTALAKYKNKKQLFVFMHITPFTWTKNGIDCPELVTLFEKQSNLKAIFHGHDHDQDNVKKGKGKPYFFDSHIGGNWGTSYRGYRIVEVLKSGEILTYQVNPQTSKKVNNTTI